ncbi:class I SAM-dependent methyltransferase [Ectopseudomonas khazarica]|uniref:class I SAM-dependent methyltransferase n=1 Tax=Ectopseudomonas khazarica TaxID=2502979 RepID=UPI00106DD73E|nr:class I SAM-dependent methyltransferase [Pseudomonas khazarica]
MKKSTLPNQTHMQSLKHVRKHELDSALEYFPQLSSGQPCRVLELGAGTGQQARHISDLGYKVSALDLPSSSYKDARQFHIDEYDGENLPFADETYDVIFSSNVLEHVVSIDKLLSETYRTLKPGGMAIHLIPSPACRLWSILAHYIWLMRRVTSRLMALTQNAAEAGDVPRTPQSRREWLGTLFPLRHGERGNTLTETYYFSKIYWLGKFRSNNFNVHTVSGNGLFYTMANATGAKLSINCRKALSRTLGSSCLIYVMTKNESSHA